MIDSNVSLGGWPFRALAGVDPTLFARQLETNNVTQAWTGSLEGLFDRDVAGVNLRLAAMCQQAKPGLLVPFGTVNPLLPDWEEDLRRCDEVHRFPGIRLHPNFHGYDLTLPGLLRLLQAAAERGLIVQLAVMMEDERTQHPVFRVPAVELGPLPALLKMLPTLRLVILNAFRRLTLDQAATLALAGNVWFEIAMLEGVDRVSALVDNVGPQRVLFGSHWPLFYVESAALKLQESMLPNKVVTMIQTDNAQQLLSFRSNR